MKIRRIISHFLLIGSVLGLLLLLPGYFEIVGFQFTYGLNIPGQPGAFRRVQATIEEGRFRIAIATATRQGALPRRPGFQWTNRLWPLRLATRRAGWEFDFHEMVSQPGLTIFLIGFPIWLAAIPLGIVPFMTIRRKLLQKPEPPPGFDVI